MIYEDFLQVLKNAKNNNCSSGNDEDYSSYLEQVDNYLNNYFSNEKLKKSFGVIKSRAAGKTLEEIGCELGVTRERVRQIITKTLIKLRDKYHIERNHNLKSMYSFLCSIGEIDIFGFMEYLIPKKHVLLMIINDDLYKKSIKEDVTQKMKEKAKKPKKKRPKTKVISNIDYKTAILRLLKRSYIGFGSLIEIADYLIEHLSYNLV